MFPSRQSSLLHLHLPPVCFAAMIWFMRNLSIVLLAFLSLKVFARSTLRPVLVSFWS